MIKLFNDEIVDPLYNLANTAQESLDLKLKIKKIKTSVHCQKY